MNLAAVAVSTVLVLLLSAVCICGLLILLFGWQHCGLPKTAVVTMVPPHRTSHCCWSIAK